MIISVREERKLKKSLDKCAAKCYINNMSTTTSKFQKFPLGQIVQTANIARNIHPVVVDWMLKKHHRGDWGSELCASDKRENDRALAQNDGRLLSAYLCPETKKKVWIITEHDRSVTTVLFPEDY